MILIPLHIRVRFPVSYGGMETTVVKPYKLASDPHAPGWFNVVDRATGAVLGSVGRAVGYGWDAHVVLTEYDHPKITGRHGRRYRSDAAELVWEEAQRMRGES